MINKCGYFGFALPSELLHRRYQSQFLTKLFNLT